jgi:hypothetical protein
VTTSAGGWDTLAYFTGRLDPKCTRDALVRLLRRAKRNKAFENSRSIGLAVDGSGVGRSRKRKCRLCHKHGKGWGHREPRVQRCEEPLRPTHPSETQLPKLLEGRSCP